MVNKVILVGRLGQDPEEHSTNHGTRVTTFSVATDQVWTDKDGERRKRTEWHRLVAWGKLAEVCGRYLKKGSLVFVDGRLQTRKWEDRSGEKRYRTEIVVETIRFLGRDEREAGGDDTYQDAIGEGEETRTPGGQDDIPF